MRKSLARGAGAALALVLACSQGALAIGCVRATACTLAGDAPWGGWQLTQGYRFFTSHRHFQGDVELTDRDAAGTQAINTVHFFEESLSYAFGDRYTVACTWPLQVASRSTPVMGAGGSVLLRDLAWANGPGDLQLGARAWLFPPDTAPPFNLQLGLGLKLPTGASGLTSLKTTADGSGNLSRSVQAIDPSIQPGDGGWGGLLQLSGGWHLPHVGALYLDGSYLLNPQGTNGVPSQRPAGSADAIDSIADQFLLRLGGATEVPWVPGLSASLGLRLDGVPVRDLLGPSDGFRRPGYAVSGEPGLTYAFGPYALGLDVALPFYRNRLQSLAEQAEGRFGDAAFADYLISTRFTYTFDSGHRP